MPPMLKKLGENRDLRMKILYIYGNPFFYLDSSEGPSIHINSTIKAFQDAGCEVAVFVGSTNKKMASRASNSRLPLLIKIARKTLIDLAALAYSLIAYMRILRQNSKPDFIYERYSLFSWVGLALKRKWKIPHFVEFNDPGIGTRNKYFGRTILEPVSKIIFNQLVSEAGAIIPVSRSVAAWLVSRGVSEKKIHIIPNGVSPDSFNAARCNPDEIRMKYGLQDELVIGFVGGMAPWHGVNFLVEAAQDILVEQPKARFLIVGGGANSVSEIQKIASAKGVFDRFIFTGWIKHEQVAAHLAVMDIVVAPYAPMEGNSIYFSPLKVFEYMAMGKPVVASGIDQLAEIFEDGKEIILIEPGNVKRLAGAILELASDPKHRYELGLNARKKVLETYTWENSIKKIISIYCDLEYHQS
jgi:glycosyltransferase involved in cell wall biosynthesis